MKAFSVLALPMILVLVVGAYHVHAITCSEAIPTLMSCKPFLVGSEAKPTPPCCKGVQTVKDKASSTADRKALCECFKKSGPAMGINPDRAQQLPGLCGIKLTIPVGPDVDCSKIVL